MITLPTPQSILDFTHKWGKLCLGLSIALVIAGLVWVFTQVPPDYQQGNSAKIMFLHVPAAWGSLGVYTLMSVMSLSSIIYRQPLADVVSRACAPIGLTICAICLVTGAIWGKPMWGTWWVWDARLTSMLVLFFIYIALTIMWNALADSPSAGKIMAVTTLVGFINIPIIKFSVEWWNTLHQPASVFRADGPTLAPEFLYPLLYMAIAFSCLAGCFILYAMRNEIIELRLRASQRRKFTGGQHE